MEKSDSDSVSVRVCVFACPVSCPRDVSAGRYNLRQGRGFVSLAKKRKKSDVKSDRGKTKVK